MKPTLPLLLAAVTLTLTARPTYAHRLEAEYRVLSDGRVQVESWFETDDSPKQAQVQVIGPDGKVRAEGPLDSDSGKFFFRPERAERLRIIVVAPGGHRKELTLTADELRGRVKGRDEKEEPAGAAGRWWQAGPEPDGSRRISAPDTEGGTERHARERSWTDVIAGLALLLAVPAFVLVLLQRRALGELRREVAVLRACVREGRAAAPEDRTAYFVSGKTSSSGTSH
jgi:hypothetical protein